MALSLLFGLLTIFDAGNILIDGKKESIYLLRLKGRLLLQKSYYGLNK